MAGPWEDYAPAATPAADAGPWSDYKPTHEPEDVTAGMALRGVPILGAFVPQAEAAIRAAAHPLTGVGKPGETFSERYAANLPEREAQYKSAEAESPITSEVLKLGGGLVATAPLAATGLGARAFGMTGSMPARIAAGGASGATIGGLDAAARGSDPTTGALLGGGLGGIAAPAGAAVGRVVQGARNMLPGATPAAERIAGQMGRAAAEADALTPQSIAARAAELGPEGTAAEYGRNLEGLAQAVATQPGPGKTALFDVMEQRAGGARQRIDDAVTGALGPRIDLASVTRGEQAAQKAAADPLYQAFRDTTVFPGNELRDLLPRLERDGLTNEARRLMSLEGKNPNVTFAIPTPVGKGQRMTYPTTEAYDYLKQAIDGRIGAALRNGERNVARIYTGVKKRLDAAIINSDPEAAAVWKKAREAYGNPQGIMNARELGQDIINLRRDDLRQELVGMSTPERAAVMEGIRDTFAEMMDRSLRGDTNVRNALLAPAMREKIMMVAQNKQQAAALFPQLEREIGFKETQGRLLHGSQTAARAAMGEVTKPPPGRVSTYMRALDLGRPSSWIGMAGDAAKGLEATRQGARYEAARGRLADILSQRGPQAQQGLLQLLQPPPPSLASRVSPWASYGIGGLGR